MESTSKKRELRERKIFVLVSTYQDLPKDVCRVNRIVPMRTRKALFTELKQYPHKMTVRKLEAMAQVLKDGSYFTIKLPEGKQLTIKQDTI